MPVLFSNNKKDQEALKECLKHPSYKDAVNNVSTSSKDIFRDFEWTETDEPHASRRKIILDAHPEIKSLFGPDIRTAYLMIIIGVVQLSIAYWAENYATALQIFVVAYVVGGILNHMLHLLNHDVSHNLAFKTLWLNRVIGIVGCFVTMIPSAETFRKFHLEHHRKQGVDGIDMDIPCEWEVNFFKNVWWRKIIWCACQPFAYAFRPLIMKQRGVNFWEKICYVAQILFNIAVYKYIGATGCIYLVLGTFLGTSIHPSGGHFISEHYVFLKGWETYSTYSWWNYFIVNVGYHNEHHDFPKVPWTRLPEVRSMAPEYYDTIPYHTSFFKVFWNFIFDPSIGCFARLKRPNTEQKKTK